MIRYESITYRPEGSRARTVFLRDVRDGALGVAGIEVSEDGDEVAPRGCDERLRIISPELIVRRVPLRMNLHYGLLEPATAEEDQR